MYQFARDAAVAEAWLIAQEPYLMSQELGVRGFKLIFNMIPLMVLPTVIITAHDRRSGELD